MRNFQIIALMTLGFLSIHAHAQSLKANDEAEIDKIRESTIQKWTALKSNELRPDAVLKMGETLLALPLVEQLEVLLKDMADQSNRLANFVSVIYGRYDDFRSEYKIIAEGSIAARDKYVNLCNRLKNNRNRAYFNLGLKALEKGRPIEQKILGITDIDPYTTWRPK